MNQFYILLLPFVVLFSTSTGAVASTDSIPAFRISPLIHDEKPLTGTDPVTLEKLWLEIEKIDHKIEQMPLEANNSDLQKHIYLLSKKMQLQKRMKVLEGLYELDLTKKRYKKGIDLIKMIYEKILGLDHHFSSIQTFQNITALSNPNSYPEFQKSRELLEKNLKKENSLKLPILLQSNPYLSTTFSVVASLIGGGPTKERKQELDDISCILDFTARMNSELSTIYYETEYLKEGNISLKAECLKLFLEYVEVVEYHTALDKCRKEDDWEQLYEKLDGFIIKLEAEIQKGGVSPGNFAYKEQINLEFSVDRLVKFISKYNDFISQGEKYYQKFKVIVSNYPNEELCKSKLPPRFSQLQRDIDYSIMKFNEAYNISELTGSKLKDLLYGFSD